MSFTNEVKAFSSIKNTVKIPVINQNILIMCKKILYISLLCICYQITNAQLNVQNGNFEISGDTNTTFKDWDGGATGFSITSEQNSINNGKYVLKIQNTGVGVHIAFTQKIKYRPIEMEQYIFSGYIKVKNVNTGYASLWMRGFDENGNKIFAVAHNEYGIKGTSEWEKVSINIAVPSVVSTIELGGLLIGDGEVLFDKLEFIKIGIGKIGQSETAKKYIDDALKIITENSIRRDSVDFNKLKAIANSIAADAKTTTDCYIAIKNVLQGLGDKHSFFHTAEEEKLLESYVNSKVEMPTGTIIDNKIGYITVPAFQSANEKLQVQYAETMQNIIKNIDNKNIIGWIVDIRNNTGGNCAPMIVGIGPILGDGIFNYYANANGKKVASSYLNGEWFNNGNSVFKINSTYTLLQQNPNVAVLTNEQCGSSGEIIVLGFKNRPKAKSFGTPTYGVSTWNADFKLIDDSVIYLTTGIGCDRLGNVYGGKIQPDIFIKDNESSKADKVLYAAVKWLKDSKQ